MRSPGRKATRSSLTSASKVNDRIETLGEASSPRASDPLLAFDCAGNACSAALLVEGRIAGHRAERRGRGHAERLLPLLEEVLSDAALSWNDIQRFAVTRGPGSFTGVRIGLATARALALASRRPLFALDCFSLYAAMVGERLGEAKDWGRPLLVAIDSRRKEIFVQSFFPDGTVDQARTALPEDLAEELRGTPFLLAGDGSAQLVPHLQEGDFQIVPNCDMADSRTLARWAAQQAEGAATPAARPLYLRPPDVTFAKERRGG